MKGTIATAALLTVYFTLVSLISGWSFAVSQFFRYWYFLLGLALGFGIQIGLYSFLRSAVRRSAATRGVVAVSGTTSTIAMVSCCAHYLANIVPVIGVTGALSLVGQYQVELFWVGLAANVVGIAYIGRKIRRFLRTP